MNKIKKRRRQDSFKPCALLQKKWLTVLINLQIAVRNSSKQIALEEELQRLAVIISIRIRIRIRRQFSSSLPFVNRIVVAAT